MRRWILGLMVLALATSACRMEMQQVAGRISVAGHEPFSYVRLVDPQQREYRLVGEKAGEIRQSLQGHEVVLRGRVVKEAVGPGRPAEFRVEEILAR